MAKKKRRRKATTPKKKASPATKSASQQEAKQRKIKTVYLALFAILSIILLAYLLVYRGDLKLGDFFRLNSGKHGQNDQLAFPPPISVKKPAPVRFEDFVGSEACANCHLKQYDLWRNSTHGRAGGEPDKVKILGQFDGRPRQFKDATVVPKRDAEGDYAFTVEQNSFPKKTFHVDAVVGGGHMYGGGTQTYFSRFPDGTLRFLPFDFIRREKVWFGETKDQRGWIPISKELSITDLSEWPPSRILGGEPGFKNCQECHGSQIQTYYDAQQKKYVSRYQTLQINCESCHGPGRQHIELIQSGRADSSQFIGMQPLDTVSKDRSIEICSRCHALKDQLTPGYLPGNGLQDHYSLKLPLLGRNPFYPDGRVKAFAYQQNHMFSDCYLNGSMTCVDCHDPHSQAYRDVRGKPLVGKFDNGQCTDCHPSKAIAPEKHSHHRADSPGNLCTSCHFPFLQHRAMGKKLRFARSDHTIPIPRPFFDEQLGIDNACSKCHRDKSVAWLQNKVEEWYGQIKPHKPIVTGLLEAEKITDRVEAARLLLDPRANFSMAQAAGLSYFIERFLRPDMPSLETEIVEKFKAFAENADLDIKALALMGLHFSQGQAKKIRQYLIDQLNHLGDEDLLIRKRWSIAMGYLGSVYRDRGDLNDAIVIYQKALEVLPNHEPTLTNLGYAYQQLGDYRSALNNFEKASFISPNDPMIYVNMGISYRHLGNLEEARKAYQQAIQVNPWHPLGYFNLGNLSYQEKDFTKAITYYQKAVELDPALAPGYFYLARCYIQIQKMAKALRAVQAGLQYDPKNRLGRQMYADLKRYLRGKNQD